MISACVQFLAEISFPFQGEKINVLPHVFYEFLDHRTEEFLVR